MSSKIWISFDMYINVIVIRIHSKNFLLEAIAFGIDANTQAWQSPMCVLHGICSTLHLFLQIKVGKDWIGENIILRIAVDFFFFMCTKS